MYSKRKRIVFICMAKHFTRTIVPLSRTVSLSLQSCNSKMGVSKSCAIIILTVCFSCVTVVRGDWCSEGNPVNGTHDLGADCSLTGEVLVSGADTYLDIIGKLKADTTKPVITRANANVKHRFFRASNGATIILRNLVLEGGDVSALAVDAAEDKTCKFCGGAVLAEGVNTVFKAYAMEFKENIAFNGGALHAMYGAAIEIVDSLLPKCTIVDECAPYGSAFSCRGHQSCSIRTSAIYGAIDCLCSGIGSITVTEEYLLRSAQCHLSPPNNQYPNCKLRL